MRLYNYYLALVCMSVIAWAQPASAQQIPTERFAQLPSISKLRISPDGQYIAMLRPFKGILHLVVRPSDGSANPIIVPPIKNGEINKFRWANNERLLIHTSVKHRRGRIETVETRLLAVNRDGTEFENIIRTDQDHTQFSNIKSKYSRAQIQDDVVDYLHEDPDHILLAIDEEMRGLYNVRKININSGRFQNVRAAMRGVQNWLSDQQGSLRFGWGIDTKAFDMGRTTNKFLYYAGTDDLFREVREGHIANRLDPLAFTEDPNIAYMSGTNEHGRRGIYLTDMTSGEIVETVFSDEQYDAGNLIRDPMSNAPIGVYYIGEKMEMQIFDPDWSRRYQVINKALADTTNTIVSTTTDRTLHVISSVSEREPGMFYLYDEPNTAIHPLGMAYNDLEPSQLSPATPINYTARDGTTIPGYLTLPLGSDGKNMPTVILPHGGPHSRDSMEFDYLAQFLANRGYAVLQPNFRGSWGYGRDFLRAGYEQWGLLMQDDVTDGTHWMINEGIADPSRTCIMGWSYGGYAALMGAAKEPDLYKCAISINGVTDIPRLVRNAKDYIGGTVMTRHINQEGAKDVSPVHLAEQITAPILLIASEDDTNVEYRHSRDMDKALKRKKVPRRYVKLEDGGHSLEHVESRLIALQEIEKWLDKYIGE